MNTRNFSQKSNYMCGSPDLDLLPFYVQSINIPGINFSLPEVGGRGGARITLNSDNITFNTLSLEIIVDEDYKIYKELTDIVFKHINVETGTFAAFSFDFWMEMTDDMGKKVMKVDYYNCKIESIGDLSLDSMDDMTEQIFSVEIRYDYHKISFENSSVPTLSI